MRLSIKIISTFTMHRWLMKAPERSSAAVKMVLVIELKKWSTGTRHCFLDSSSLVWRLAAFASALQMCTRQNIPKGQIMHNYVSFVFLWRCLSTSCSYVNNNSANGREILYNIKQQEIAPCFWLVSQAATTSQHRCLWNTLMEITGLSKLRSVKQS